MLEVGCIISRRAIRLSTEQTPGKANPQAPYYFACCRVAFADAYVTRT